MSVILPILTEFNDKGVKSATQSLKNLAKVYATTAISGGLITDALVKTVKDASDLNETISKTGVIFGKSTDELLSFSRTAADTFGQSQKQALDAASTFATFGKAAGLSDTELVDFSTSLTKLSSDFASFFNTSPEDAITAIGAALRGESEPIRRYGVLLNDAALKQRAMSMGIYDGTGALTAQQKTLAAYSEILAQSTDAQGDFERTQDGLANKSRTLRANLSDLSAEIGQNLLPTVNDYVSAAVKLADEIQATGDESQGTVGKLAEFGLKLAGIVTSAGQMFDALQGLSGVVRNYANDVEEAKTATELWADSMIAIERRDLRAQMESARAERRRDYLEQQRLEEARKKAAEARAAAEKKAAAEARRRAAEARRLAEQEKQALKDLATTVTQDLISAADAARDVYLGLLDQQRQYAEGLRDQITGLVSLSDAVRTSQESEDKVNEALRERADAYAELNRLQAERRRRGFDISDQVTYDAEEYARALQRIEDAERGVTDAQSKRVNYVDEFLRQLTAAKDFANYLRALSNAGLQEAGLQQIMGLGPQAGIAVAQELLRGTGQLTIGGLNAELSTLAGQGMALGNTVAPRVFGSQIDQAAMDMLAIPFGARAANVNNQVVIQVSGGDPEAVVSALRKYMTQFGAVPIKVTG